jgi:hypothetical protein
MMFLGIALAAILLGIAWVLCRVFLFMVRLFLYVAFALFCTIILLAILGFIAASLAI